MSRRLTIGVTGPDRGGLIAWLMTALAIRRSGARAIRITPSRTVDPHRLDAVVIGGGTDVDPFHYGQQPEPDDEEPGQRSTPVDWLVGLVLGLFRVLFASYSVQDYDPDRDELEKKIIRHALYHQVPVLGICRGAQLINVVLGGSLYQKIGHFYTEETSNVRSILPRKTINLTPQSRLHRILQRGSCRVNALHNQSINQLGEDLMVSAVEPSGVVQSIEKRDHSFCLGVQWHPEYMPQSKTQQRLFRALAGSARQRLDAGGQAR